MTLDELKVNQTGLIIKINITGPLRRRLQDMGMVVGTSIVCIIKQSSDSPIAFKVRDSIYALRIEDAKNIKIKLLTDGD